jgi:DNA-binding response OmpR family regulator
VTKESLSQFHGTPTRPVRFFPMTNDPKRGADTKTETILVIEPDVLIRMVIADYLRECGYKVVEGVSADDVFAVLKADITIDIVFSEVTLPGDLGGFDLAQKIRAAYPQIHVVLASGADGTAHKAGDLCENGPLTKPYHPQDVIRRIDLLRERRRTSK